MAIIGYFFALLISLVPLLIGIYLILPRHKKIIRYIGALLIFPFIYLMLSTCVFMLPSRKVNSEKIVLSGENDFLIGTDYIYLLNDQTFMIQYVDHMYYGTYHRNENKIILDTDINLFAPLRHSLSDTLIDFNEYISDNDGHAHFNVYDSN